MRTLRARIALTLVLFGLATLASVGSALFVVMRDLYRDSATAALADIAVPYVAQARRFGPGRGGDGHGSNDIEQLVADLQQLAADRSGDLYLYLIGSDGTAYDIGTGETAALSLTLPDANGAILRSTGTIDGVGAVTYAAAPLFGERLPAGVRSLVFAQPDDSSQRALSDLLWALGIAALVLLLIGAPLALWLSRSVSRPLARLAAATGIVARGDIPVELPVTGPTEVAQASAAFNAMSREVAHGREAQRQLVADLRHDLRTPLTVIGGFAEALKDGTAQGPAIPRAAELIVDETQRMERMLGDLGALADLERGGRPLEVVRLDGSAVMRDAATRFAPTASARGQRLDVEAAPGGLPVMGDQLAVDRIVANLVANAMAHTRSHIWLEARAVAPTDPPVGGPGGWEGRPGVVLAVRDDGPGIPADMLPRIFDRFFRGDPSRTGPGSGLGLAIVAELAVAQGGRAFAESRPGNGARVGVVLPAAG
ncbi:MAG: HAMP domain-containing sensor histidine kinase [Chloroflexota bacterium]